MLFHTHIHLTGKRKVMFSEASVSHFVHRRGEGWLPACITGHVTGVSASRRGSASREGVCIQVGIGQIATTDNDI